MLKLSLNSSKRILTSSPQKRGFLIASLAALTNSSYLKDIRLVDEFESLDSKKPSKTTQHPQNTVSKVSQGGKINLSGTEQVILAAVSGINSFLHPEIGYNIVNFGEATAFEFILKNLRDRMLETPSGRKILRERPSFDANTLDLEKLSKLPENTLGYQYNQFTKDGDERAPVRFIKDDELAYVFQRYRQIHDIVHILLSCKIDLAGELPVKAFEFGNTALPMTGIACGAYFKLSAKRKAKVEMIDSYLNGLEVTPLVGVYWEELMDKDIDELRANFGIH